MQFYFFLFSILSRLSILLNIEHNLPIQTKRLLITGAKCTELVTAKTVNTK